MGFGIDTWISPYRIVIYALFKLRCGIFFEEVKWFDLKKGQICFKSVAFILLAMIWWSDIRRSEYG
jgi:hypothetical protein